MSGGAATCRERYRTAPTPGHRPARRVPRYPGSHGPPRPLRDPDGPHRQAHRRPVREQRVRRALQGHRRGRHHRRRQRARAAARGEPGHRRPPGAHHPRPLGPHPGGRGDARRRDRRRASPRDDAVDAPGLRLRDPRRRRDRGRRPAAAHDPQPRPHAGLHVVPARGAPDRCSAATPCSRAGAGNTSRSRAATSSRSSSRSTAACSRSRPTSSCCPATASTPRSAPSAPTSRSGSTGAGDVTSRTGMLRANDDCWCGSGKKYKRCHRPRCCAPARSGPGATVPARDRASRLRGDRARPVRTTEVDGEVARRDRADARRVPDRARRARETGAAVAPGVTTDELDRIAHEAHIAARRVPEPARYRGFPKSVCTSVNEVICHGIPDDRALADGDIVNVDVTVYVDGVHGDTNATFCVGRRRPGVASASCASPRSASTSRIEAVRPGAPLLRHRARDRDARARARASSSCGPSSATASARSSTARRRCRTTTSAATRTDPRAGHGVHHRADDHHGQHRSP